MKDEHINSSAELFEELAVTAAREAGDYDKSERMYYWYEGRAKAYALASDHLYAMAAPQDGRVMARVKKILEGDK